MIVARRPGFQIDKLLEVHNHDSLPGTGSDKLANIEREHILQVLEKTNWMAGDSYSLAEIGYTPYLIRLDELRLWSWMDDRPHITDLYGRLKARANFRAGYLDWKNQAYVDLMAEKGAEAWPKIQEILRSG